MPASAAESQRRFRFGAYELDVRAGELRKNGLTIKLQKQPLQILTMLLEQPGEVITRKALRNQLWPADTFVDFDHGLNSAVKRLRDVLGDSGDNPLFIETLPRYGYRFIGPVDRADSGTSSASNSKPQVARFRAPKVVVALGATLLVLLGSGIWWISRNSAETNLAGIEMIPLAGAPQGYQCAASFSPDGNQLAFDQTGEQNSGIHVTLTDGEKSLRLTSNPGDCCPAWSPDGQQIAFSRYSGGRLAIYVISPLGGTERRLYQEPAHFRLSSSGYLAWSPDAKFLAFSDRQENDAHTSIALLSMTDSSKRRLTTPPDRAFDYGPAFSPDGSQVAFIRRNIVASDVYVVPASGGEPKRLTFDNADTDGTPAWTENGRDIVFSSIRGGLSTLWRIPAAGGKPRAIAGVGAIACCPSISRKRNQLVYQNSNVNYGVWRVGLKDQTHVQGIPSLLISARGQNLRPDFSPDGSKIALESDRSGYAEIWTCNSNGSGCGQVTSMHGVAGTARWSPDGSHIAFEFTQREHSEVYVVDVAGGRPQLVPTLPGANNLAPSWSRDGEWIYFTSDHNRGRFDLWKVPLKGGSPVRVTDDGGVYGVESFDRRFLYYSKLEAPGVWKRSLSGGEETQVLDKSGSIHWYDWALVRNGIYFIDTPAEPKAAIEFLDFESGKITRVFSPEKPVNWGVIASPDARYIVYVQNDLSQSSLVLVKNFR